MDQHEYALTRFVFCTYLLLSLAWIILITANIKVPYYQVKPHAYWGFLMKS